MSTRVLAFEVNGQTVRKKAECDFGGLVAGTKGYLAAEFNFDTTWKGCKIAASFFNTAGKEEAVPVINGKCQIPEKVLRGDVFRVSVTGMREGYTIKTNRLTIRQGR